MNIRLLKSCLIVAGMAVVNWTAVAQTTNQLHFPLSGFSIGALEEVPGKSSQNPLFMLLPAADGFAANVNVLIQPYTESFEKYVAESRTQFKELGVEIIQDKMSGKTIAVFEYKGDQQGRKLHWYARAEKSADRIYVVTATALNDQWSKQATRLTNCVNSFHCDSPEQTALPKANPTQH